VSQDRDFDSWANSLRA
jgi:hypothetical protein